MRIGAVVAAGLVTVAVALVLVLLDLGQRQAGSNYVPELSQAVTIKGTGSHCQGGQLIPADAASLRLLVGTYENPTPKLSVSHALPVARRLPRARCPQAARKVISRFRLTRSTSPARTRRSAST